MSRVLVAIDNPCELALIEAGVTIARRREACLEILCGRPSLSIWLAFATVDREALADEIVRERQALLMKAVACVPGDLALEARLVEGRAAQFARRQAERHPSEVVAIATDSRRQRLMARLSPRESRSAH